DSASRMALRRDHSKQCIDWHGDIAPAMCAEAIRYHIQALKAQNVVEADRAGIAKRSSHHLAKRLKGLTFKTDGIETGKTPILTCNVQEIRRRANRQVACKRRLLEPCVESTGPNSHRDVEIEANRHAKRRCEISATAQLLVGT